MKPHLSALYIQNVLELQLTLKQIVLPKVQPESLAVRC